jgi:hypothetical protein
MEFGKRYAARVRLPHFSQAGQVEHVFCLFLCEKDPIEQVRSIILTCQGASDEHNPVLMKMGPLDILNAFV